MKVCFACKRCFDDTAESCVEAGHPRLSDSPGHHLMVSGYSLDQLVAASNKADVYLARRLDCDRQCIIRIVSADDRYGEAFLRDAGQAAGVFDARIADIYEAGTLESGQYFVVEELIEGQTLRAHLDTAGTPELLTSIRIVEQVAEALHALHLKGLTHGAVRPDNVFLNFDYDGRPAIKLSGIDLGGVIAHNTISNKFVIDTALDAIRYFAPEQCSGVPACAQTDVYSLGVLLYELLAGVSPFDAPKAVALMDMHRTQRPPEVMIDDLDLRMLVAHSLSESLQKQSSFRQSTADLFARQMRHIEQLATHVSTPPPAVIVPAAPVFSPSTATSEPVISHLPAAELAREDGFGIAYARAVETTPEMESEPATPKFDPVATHDDIGEPPVVFESTFIAAKPTHIDSEPTQKAASELWGSVDDPDVELPVHRTSALAERRHRLKTWRRSSNPVPEPQRETSGQPESDPESDLISRLGPSIAFDFSQPVEEVRPEPLVMPKLIEWDQHDDVPSIDETEAESSPKFAAFDLDFSSSIEETVALPVTASPHLIEWEQPEDDIPSIEDVIEARSQEETTDVRAIHFTPEDSEVVAAIKFRINTEDGGPKERHDPDAVSESLSPKAVGVDVNFVPTILGDKRWHESSPTRQPFASIMNAHEPPLPSRSIPYRSISIGVLLMAVAAVIGLGGDPMWQYFTAQDPGGSVAEAPNDEERPIQPTRSARVEPPTSESGTQSSFFEDIPSYEGPSTVVERPTTDAPKSRRRGQDRRGTVTRETKGAENSRFEPSTLVITYGNGGVQSANSAQKESHQNGASPSGEKAAGATRPRIVANPRN